MTLQTVTCGYCGAELEADIPAEVPTDARDVRVECHAPLLDAEGAPVTNAAGAPLQCGRVTILLTRSPAPAADVEGADVTVVTSDSVGSIDLAQ